MSTYGYFDDQNREFVITRPDTPLPWLNMLGQDEFYGLCTQTAGGYSFWKDARLRRLTRYRYNNNPMDNDGRFLYVKQGKTVWNPGWKPTRDYARRLRVPPRPRVHPDHRPQGRRGSGAADVRPAAGEPGGLAGHRSAIGRGRPRSCRSSPSSSSASIEALNDMTNYQRTYSIGEVEVEGSAIYHKTEYRERRNHYTLFGCTRQIDGYDTSRDAFVGVHHGLHDPQAVLAGKCTNSHAYGWNPVGAHQVDLALKPGQEETFAFVLAYVEQGDLPKFDAPFVMNKAKGREILAQVLRPRRHRRALSPRSRRRWEELLAIYQAPRSRTPTSAAWSIPGTRCSAWPRSIFRAPTSGYETGIGRGMGYRDSNQDILGFVHLLPDARPPAHPRHRLDPALRRHLLSPVPAAHEEGQRRHRRRLQ